MNKKLFIGIGIVLVLLIIGCSILIVKINSEPKTEEKIEEKAKDSKDEKKPEEKKPEEKKTEEKKEEKKEEPKKTEEKKSDEKKEEQKTEGEGKKVPDLTGLTLDEAIEKLNSNKIASSFSLKRMDSDKPKDTIVKTEPAAGATYEDKLEIVFYLSNGPKTNGTNN